MEAYPLTWPAHRPRTPASHRKRASFGKKEHNGSYHTNKPLSLNQACNRVLDELNRYTRVGKDYRVPEESIIISTNVPVRLDGLPYSNARKPDDPGAAVYFTLDNKQYCLPCDRWDRVEDNIAAIAAHIAAMRGIERWGVGESHDVYTGYKALPERTAGSVKPWWDVLGISNGATVEEIKAAYKRLARICHPDAGGTKEQWDQLSEAYNNALNAR